MVKGTASLSINASCHKSKTNLFYSIDTTALFPLWVHSDPYGISLVNGVPFKQLCICPLSRQTTAPTVQATGKDPGDSTSGIGRLAGTSPACTIEILDPLGTHSVPGAIG